MQYRFPHWKDATWNSYERQLDRYNALRPFLGKNLVGAEIGVYKGGFGEFLLPHCSKLYLVDSWYRGGPFWNTEIDNDSRVDTVINILSIYKSDIEQGRVEVIVDYSWHFLPTISDAHFDFIYIDASHKYEETINELRLSRSKLKNDGYVFGDDYDPDPKSRQHGVFRAVNNFAEEANANLILNETRQWGLTFRR